MIDSDLAELYGVETRVLNQAAQRNLTRFPEDFMFPLGDKEWAFFKSQFVTLSWGGGGSYPTYLQHTAFLRWRIRKVPKARI